MKDIWNEYWMATSTNDSVPYFRAALILLCAMFLFNLPTVIYKIGMAINAILYLLFCNDKKWDKPTDPDKIVSPLLKKQKVGFRDHSGQQVHIDRKTIYFVRHGESTWNDTFNKGSHRSALAFVIGFIPGLIKAIVFEMYIHLSGKLDRYVGC